MLIKFFHLSAAIIILTSMAALTLLLLRTVDLWPIPRMSWRDRRCLKMTKDSRAPWIHFIWFTTSRWNIIVQITNLACFAQPRSPKRGLALGQCSAVTTFCTVKIQSVFEIHPYYRSDGRELLATGIMLQAYSKKSALEPSRLFRHIKKIYSYDPQQPDEKLAVIHAVKQKRWEPYGLLVSTKQCEKPEQRG